MFLQHAWHAYGAYNRTFQSLDDIDYLRTLERDAMGDDEYHPISRTGTNLSSAGGIGYTVTDALDTMMIMGLDEEVARSREWVQTKLTFDRPGEFNTFEVRSTNHS